jgi:hypothetical protein
MERLGKYLFIIMDITKSNDVLASLLGMVRKFNSAFLVKALPAVLT